jgi:hypothetical protein
MTRGHQPRLGIWRATVERLVEAHGGSAGVINHRRRDVLDRSATRSVSITHSQLHAVLAPRTASRGTATGSL